AAFLTLMVCVPVARPLQPEAGYTAYAPPSILNSSPAVAVVTVMVPVATVHVGSTAASVAVGEFGAVSIAWFNVVSKPPDFLPLMVCVPVARPLQPEAGYTAYAPPSILNSSPAVAVVTVMVPVATVHVGSTAASVAVGAFGAVAISFVNVVS